MIKKIYDVICKKRRLFRAGLRYWPRSAFILVMEIRELSFETFKWQDMINPSKEVLEQLANELEVPKKVIMNCLDPDYLPHVETYGGTQFILLRLMEPDIKLTADTVQELTTKVALFVSADRVVSIHRLPLIEIEEITAKIKKQSPSEIVKILLVGLFYEQVSLGFDDPLTKLEYKLEKFEERMFQSQKTKSLLLEGYYIKRQASAFRKVMKLTVDSVTRIMQRVESPPSKLQETRDRLDRNLFYAEDVFDNVQSLLNLHMAIESQRTNEGSFRTNEIMRVLTVLTIFFLPLNFVAGVFGMNFQHIPLLSHPAGFWYSMGLMLVMSLALSVYVVRKGWLAQPPTGS